LTVGLPIVALFQSTPALLSTQPNLHRRTSDKVLLCLEFPGGYPGLNQPVRDYLKAIKFEDRGRRAKVVRYIDLARKLRSSLLPAEGIRVQAPDYPAKNLAEIDTIIWLEFGKK